MDDRIKKLEEFAERTEPRLARIESRLDSIDTRLEGMATKEDLKDAMLTQLKWMIGVMLVLLTFFFTSVAFLLDVIKLAPTPSPPPVTATAAPPPVVIYLPQPQAK